MKRYIKSNNEILNEDIPALQDLIVAVDNLISYISHTDMAKPSAQTSIAYFIKDIKGILDKLPQSIYYDDLTDDERMVRDGIYDENGEFIDYFD